MPSGAKVFIRTAGHNGYAEVGRTPITLCDVEPGLLEYTLLRNDCQLYDGSLWVEPGKEHIERVRMKPGRVFFVDQKHPKASDANPGTEAAPWKTINKRSKNLCPGDTVLVKEGKYVEADPTDEKASIGCESGTMGVLVVRSGEPGRPITFRAYPGHEVKVEAIRVPFVFRGTRHCDLGIHAGASNLRDIWRGLRCSTRV